MGRRVVRRRVIVIWMSLWHLFICSLSVPSTATLLPLLPAFLSLYSRFPNFSYYLYSSHCIPTISIFIIFIVLFLFCLLYYTAISMSNTGGAWDNAKKYIEGGHDPSLGKKKNPVLLLLLLLLLFFVVFVEYSLPNGNSTHFKLPFWRPPSIPNKFQFIP